MHTEKFEEGYQQTFSMSTLPKGIGMDLRTLIEQGEAKKDGRKGLADFLGVGPQQLTNAKAHRSPLPDYACLRLAELLELPAIDVIAASHLATEKNPERRAVWTPFVERYARVAGLVILVTSNVCTVPESRASTGVAAYKDGGIQIMRRLRAWLTRTIGPARNTSPAGPARWGFAGL